MKKLLLTALAAISITAYGQTFQFSKAADKAHRQRMERKGKGLQSMHLKTAAEKSSLSKAPIIDESTVLMDNTLYRYVFAYNKNMERSSETVYRKYIRSDEEELYTKGTYTYEYDSQGRIISKTVIYSQGTGLFDSYNIAVKYLKDYTEYTRSWIYSNNELVPSDKWSYYPNGKFRHIERYGYNSTTPERSITFDENGSCIEFSNSEMTKKLSGTLNDSIIAYSYSDSYRKPHIERYRYNPDNGKLIEYKKWGGYQDNERYVYEYDQFGRISAIKEYKDSDDDDDVDTSPYALNLTASTTDDLTEPEWILDNEQTYSYFNNDVYDTGNTWHDVFQFDGPVTRWLYTDYDTEDGTPRNEETKISRDESGKILSVTYSNPEHDGEINTKTIDVDGNGHITRQTVYSKESYGESYDEENIVYTYTWDGDQVTKQKEDYTSKSSRGEGTHHAVWNRTYSYGDDLCKITEEKEGSGTYTVSIVKKANKGYSITEETHDANYNSVYRDRFIQEVQTEDVSFVKPNLLKDYDGFSIDSTIVVSTKNRVVAYMKGHGYNNDYKYGCFEGYAGDYYAYFNTTHDNYFSVSHDGEFTVCNNAEGLPVYVLKGNKLIDEYIYDEVTYPTNSDFGNYAKAIRKTEPVAGIEYTKISYVYDEYDRPSGQTIKVVDKELTTEVTVEYKYNPASGIEDINVNGNNGMTLNGRVLGIGNGKSFNIYTIDGTPLANSVQQFHFNNSGTYLIKVGNKTVKMNVR